MTLKNKSYVNLYGYFYFWNFMGVINYLETKTYNLIKFNIYTKNYKDRVTQPSHPIQTDLVIRFDHWLNGSTNDPVIQYPCRVDHRSGF